MMIKKLDKMPYAQAHITGEVENREQEEKV